MEFAHIIDALSGLDLAQLKQLIEHAEGVRQQRREEMRIELEKQAGVIGLVISEPAKPKRRKRRNEQVVE